MQLAALFATTALHGACGGSGDTPPAPAPAPAVVPSFFETAAISRDGVLNQGFVLDVDATPPLKLALADLADLGDFSLLYPSQARSVDSVARTVTYLGAGQGTYVRGGKVYTVNLRKDGVPAEVQVSSVTTACNLADQFEVAADGSDTWFMIDEAGPDGDCAAMADNRVAMVRTTGTAASAPVFLPIGMQMLQRLPNADMSLRWLLANDSATIPARLVLYSADMVLGADVAGGTSAAFVQAVVGYDTPFQPAYLQVGDKLKQLTWGAAGAALSASLYTYTSSINSGLGVSDSTAAYFVDGATLLRIVGTAAPTVVLPDLGPTTSLANLRQTPTHIAFMAMSPGAFTGALMTVAKSGGAAHTLAASVSQLQWGTHGEEAVYFDGSDSTGDWHRAKVDGSGDTTIASHVHRVGALLDPVQADRDFGLGLVGIFYCDVGAVAVNCNGGSLVQYDLATATRTTIGSFAASAGATRVRASGNVLKGRGGVVRVSAQDGAGATRQDVYLFKPGTAGSLVRVTSNVP